MAGKTAYKNQWQAEKCDRINFVVPKGTKDIIKEHTKMTGESVNAFLLRAVKQAMDGDNLDKAIDKHLTD